MLVRFMHGHYQHFRLLSGLRERNHEVNDNLADQQAFYEVGGPRRYEILGQHQKVNRQACVDVPCRLIEHLPFVNFNRIKSCFTLPVIRQADGHEQKRLISVIAFRCSGQERSTGSILLGPPMYQTVHYSHVLGISATIDVSNSTKVASDPRHQASCREGIGSKSPFYNGLGAPRNAVFSAWHAQAEAGAAPPLPSLHLPSTQPKLSRNQHAAI